ncbi:expressed protein [Phakopsora pachyrhizi]|uniref:Expressed protein n=1 Tax=Phakopsora pachyrhizi TaxID=170000 RepID=A0AAV0B4E6_PHAPC|nr:expressed protein [Phakopsora pachyrhizi]
MLSKKTGQKIGRERNLRVNQLKSPPIRRSQASGNKLSSLSSTNHHPEVCSYSKSVSNVNQNLQVDCDINAVPFADTSETNFKSNAVNFESFLASFSPVALFSAINYFSENSQPPCNDSIETVSPFSTTVLNTVNCPSESREISALEPPVGLYGTDGFSHLLLENQSTQQEYTGAGLFAASDCAIFDEWNFISRPNISPITTLDYEEDVNLQRGLEEDTQRSLKSYKCSQGTYFNYWSR